MPGARMIHRAPNTTSTIISKSIVKKWWVNELSGEQCDTKRVLIILRSHVECDTLMLDDQSLSDTIPTNEVKNNTSYIEHEATVSKN